MDRPTAWRVTFLAVIGLACLAERRTGGDRGGAEKDDAVVATRRPGADPRRRSQPHAGQGDRRQAGRGGGRAVSPRPDAGGDWSPGGWRWPTPGGAARRPRRPRSTPPWPDLKTTLRSQHRSLDDFLKRQSIGKEDLRRQLAWNVVWQRYLGPLRHAGAEREVFPGPPPRAGRQPGFGEPYPAAAGARRGKAIARRPDEAGRGNPRRDPRRADFLRRRGGKILGRAQRQAGWPAGRNRPPRHHGRGLLAGRLRPGGGRRSARRSARPSAST